MKFKVIAVVAVVLVMLIATLIYLATKNSGSENPSEQQTEQVQQ